MAILYDVPFSTYLTMQGAHFSTLRHMATSPLHYRRACDRERADTPALRLGRLTHALILTPELPTDVAVFDGKVRRGKTWESFAAEAALAGKLIVRADELQAAERMRDAVYANKAARALLAHGIGEVTVTWEERFPVPRDERADCCFHGDHAACDGVNGCGCVCHGQPDECRGVPCRARLDWLGSAGIVEVKTTRWFSPRSWVREVASRSYHAQLAHYSGGIEHHRDLGGYEYHGAQYVPVWWIVVENVYPHDVAVYRVSREDVEVGERLRRGWLQRVAECTVSGRWPGVGGDEPIDFKLPDYAQTEGLEDVDVSGIEGGATDGD